MRIQSTDVLATITRFIASPVLPDVATAMREVIELCERDLPHPDWHALRAIDFAGELPKLRAWFEQTLAQSLPEAPVRGLYFPLNHPITETGEVTLDLDVVGTEAYDPEDQGLDWLFSRHYFPDVYPESVALDKLYRVAYGTRKFGEQVEGALENDAEWPLGLAFAVLAARAVLEGRAVRDLPTDSLRVGVAAGWGEGDLLLVGEVTEQGFVPAIPQFQR